MIGHLMRSGENLSEVLQKISHSISELFKTDDCSFMMLNSNTSELNFIDSPGLTPWEQNNIRFRIGEGVAGWVAENRRSVLISNPEQDDRFQYFPGQERNINSIICVPLLVRDKLLGVVSVTASGSQEKLDQRSLEILEIIGNQLALTIENFHLYKDCITDSLTGLYNRQYVLERINKEISYTKRVGTPISVAMVDIDFFKKVNDTYGHLVGDQALVHVSSILRQAFRDYDLVARYGGEEFLILLISSDQNNAFKVLDRVRRRIEVSPLIIGDAIKLNLTISGGISSFSLEDGYTTEQLIEQADKRLYLAKTQGRNQIISLDSEHSL